MLAKKDVIDIVVARTPGVMLNSHLVKAIRQ